MVAICDHLPEKPREVSLVCPRRRLWSKLARFFGGISTAEVIAPQGADLPSVHEAYVKIAQSGKADPESRAVLVDAGRRLVSSDGAEAVLLGGTDLVLVMDGPEVDYPVVDCAGVHIEVLARLAGQPRSE